MAKSKRKSEKKVRVQLPAAVTAIIGGVKFINGKGIVPEKVAKAKGWKILSEVKSPVEEKPPEKPKAKTDSKKDDKTEEEAAFEPADSEESK